MAKTTQMRLVELMTLKQDISNVIEYLGKCGCFQFQSKKLSGEKTLQKNTENIDRQFFENLQNARTFLGIEDINEDILSCDSASDDDRDEAAKIMAAVNELSMRFSKARDESLRVEDAYKEALAFSNLQVPYSELEHLSFLAIRIGKIPSENISLLKDALGAGAVIVPLGDDKTRIMAVTSKKGRFALDTELKNYGFVSMNIPSDFKGIPDDVLEGLKIKKEETSSALTKLEQERLNYAQTHKDVILRLLKSFCIGMQIADVENSLESTSLVYRITGWIPAENSLDFMKSVDNLTEGRIAVREYLPSEVPAVINGEEKVPVKLTHKKFVQSFERMIFSYGSPLYGNIDPTPFVAIFFTLLFGIMFGDFGQGLVFFILGLLMHFKVVKVGGWNKFAPIFMAIGCSSCLMGLITGEFFANETILEPFALKITGMFGNAHSPIVKMMPSSDPGSVKVIFGIFGVTVGIGFIINSVGLIINVINCIIQKKIGKALFGKTGIAGIAFFWYVVFFGLRLAFFDGTPAVYDWIVIGITLFFAAFGEPFERIVDKERPILENGLGSALIGGLVELIEVVSTYLSSSISFVRVGAFALAHAVLGFIIHLMTAKAGPIGGIFVMIFGNVVVIVLEGMIVAIQVMRLQYYEFFSKFFNETGSEFKPFQFHYGNK